MPAAPFEGGRARLSAAAAEVVEEVLVLPDEDGKIPRAEAEDELLLPPYW